MKKWRTLLTLRKMFLPDSCVESYRWKFHMVFCLVIIPDLLNIHFYYVYGKMKYMSTHRYHHHVWYLLYMRNLLQLMLLNIRFKALWSCGSLVHGINCPTVQSTKWGQRNKTHSMKVNIVINLRIIGMKKTHFVFNIRQWNDHQRIYLTHSLLLLPLSLSVSLSLLVYSSCNLFWICTVYIWHYLENSRKMSWTFVYLFSAISYAANDWNNDRRTHYIVR